jgi:hypothetical protein
MRRAIVPRASNGEGDQTVRVAGCGQGGADAERNKDLTVFQGGGPTCKRLLMDQKSKYRRNGPLFLNR